MCARGHLISIKVAVQALLEQKISLEQSEREATSKAETALRDLAICRLRLSQVSGMMNVL